MTIAVTAIDLADDSVCGEAAAIVRAADTFDVPDMPVLSLTRLMGRLRTGDPGSLQRGFVGTIDGRMAGVGVLQLPMRENLTGAQLYLYVLPEARRRGLGRAIHDHLLAEARAEGRTSVLTNTSEHIEGGPVRTGHGSAFAAALGYHRALPAVCRRVDLADVPVERLAAEVAPHTDGYTAVSWVGDVADEWVDDIAYLDSRLLLDAPLGDLEWEAPEPQAATIREYEAKYRSKGSTLYHAAMRHDASGRLVAWTMIEQLDEPVSCGWQQVTLVDPEHRGHRLGLAVKIENHLLIRAKAPELTRLYAWNAAENAHMIAINDAMGYRAVGAAVDWQLKL